MTDLIRQSVSWPFIHGARSYSRVTQLGNAPASETSEKTGADNPKTAKAKAETETSEPATRRGSLLDVVA
jgi:hypothetical protein